MNKDRDVYIDFVKAGAIILVILGHCIQYGSGAEFSKTGGFFFNKLFIFIYSFHMPLFMLISGYLFGYSVNKIKSRIDVYKTGKRKAMQLIVPLFFWSFVSLAIDIYKSLINEEVSRITIGEILKKTISYFIYGPWFLWAVWWCSVVVIIIKYYFKDNIFVYLTVLLLMFVTPDGTRLQLYKYMYPYFVIGCLFNTHCYGAKLKKIYMNKWFISGVFVLFVVMLQFYNYDTFIYNLGFTIVGKEFMIYQVWIDLFRFVIGALGSMSFMYFVRGLYKIFHWNTLSWIGYLGQRTLGIYIISTFIITEVLSRLSSGLIKINYWITIIEMIIVLVVSVIANDIIRRSRVLNKLLLGGR